MTIYVGIIFLIPKGYTKNSYKYMEHLATQNSRKNAVVWK